MPDRARLRRQRTLQGRRFLPGEAAVRDTLLRLGLAAAAARRRQLTGTTFIGVTGSAGKTTTKELIAAMLGNGTTSTQGNQNRISRVGLAIMRTRPGTGICVAEVAAWRPGSVNQIARLLQPRIGVVTRIGLDHHKAFRTREGVATEKRALIEALPEDGIAVLNADDPYAIAMADDFRGRTISFGESPEATLRAEGIRAAWPGTLEFTLHVEGRALPVRTRLNGKHSATSVLAALGVAYGLDVPLESVLDTVATFEPIAGRMSTVAHGGITFVCDDEKAPAWSFDALFEFVADAQATRKIMIVGTISDYPGSSARVYRRLAVRALEVADDVAFVGPGAGHVRALTSAAGKKPRVFPTVRDAADYYRPALRDGDLVVLKGSNRADHLARIRLAHTTEVGCWRTSCRRSSRCDGCRLLRRAG